MKLVLQTFLIAAIISPVLIVSNSVYQVNSFESTWDPDNTAECVIVLGARSLPGGIPGLMMRERLAMAEKVITENTKAVILTGGSLDEEQTEASVMKDQLVKAGIPESKLLTEDKSTSTLENLQFSKPLLKEANCDETDILSHDFHLARALMTARYVGVPVNQMIPAEEARANTAARLSREYLAYSWYWLSFLLHLS